MKFYKKALAGVLVAATVTAAAVPAFAATNDMTADANGGRVMTVKPTTTVIPNEKAKYAIDQKVIFSTEDFDRGTGTIFLVSETESGQPLYYVMDSIHRIYLVTEDKIEGVEPAPEKTEVEHPDCQPPKYFTDQRVIISRDGVERVTAVVYMVSWTEDGQPVYHLMDNIHRIFILSEDKILGLEGEVN